MEDFTFLSICSGLECASLAWQPLGWRPIGFAEIEPFCAALLHERHSSGRPRVMPDPDAEGLDDNERAERRAAIKAVAYLPERANGVPNFGDFTAIDFSLLPPRVDALVGGTPCQGFSVAGKRGSLSDARSNLALAYVILAHELARSHGLRNAVWENVPGILSTKDNALGCFLGALVGHDDAIPAPFRARWPDAGMVVGPRARAAWRILDAQYFGVPQRRERIFVVADFGKGADPAEVLFERQGVHGNPAPRREAGQRASETVAYGISPDCFDRSGEGAGGTAGERQGLGVDPECAYALRAKRAGGVAVPDVAGTLSARPARSGGLGTDFETAGGLVADVAGTLKASLGKRCGQADGTDAADLLVAEVAATLDASYGRLQGCSGQDLNHGHSHLVAAFGGNNSSGPIDVACALNAHGGTGRQQFETETFIAHALRAEGFDASEDGTGRGTPIVPVREPIAFTSKDYGQDAGEDIAPTLRAMPGDHANASGQVAIAVPVVGINMQGGKGMAQAFEDLAPTLGAYEGAHAIAEPVAFAQNTRNEFRLQGGDGAIAGSLAADPGMKQTTYIAEPVAFDARQSDVCVYGARAAPLDTNGYTQAVAFDLRGREDGAQVEGPHDTANIRAASGGSSRSYIAAPEIYPTLSAQEGGTLTQIPPIAEVAANYVAPVAGALNAHGLDEGMSQAADAGQLVGEQWTVRRLTPIECERLQGVPDNHTRIAWRGRSEEECPDGPRYRALGNSWARPVVAWIGARIDASIKRRGNEGSAA